MICLNGDGSMLMCLGTLATIAQSGVRNLVLFVLQNGTYEITGNQPVPGSDTIDYAAIASHSIARRRVQLPNACRSATVADRPLIYGVGRMFESMNNTDNLEMRVFERRAEAEAWLRG